MTLNIPIVSVKNQSLKLLEEINLKQAEMGTKIMMCLKNNEGHIGMIKAEVMDHEEATDPKFVSESLS